MRKLLLFSFLSIVTISGFSQPVSSAGGLERYNWYFGNSTQAIRFNRTSGVPSIVSKAIPFGIGGSSTASDPLNANLLFYTDGQRIYDLTDTQMPQGGGLTANPGGNQPVVICPVPGQTTKYFVFTNDANFTTGGTIRVTVVDMALFGNALFPSIARGDVESKNTAIAGLTSRSEGMIIVPHSNGTDFWLITQQVNSINISATLIDAASYAGGPAVFGTTTVAGLSPIPITASNFSYHIGKKKLAISAQNSSTDAFIIDFDATTGGMTFDRYIFNSGVPTVTGQSIYDVEWSASGDFLYLSRFGETGVQADLLQYDYLNPTTSLTSVLPSPVFRSFGVQITPDSSIYHLYQNTTVGPMLIGKIVKPDTIASQTKYAPAQLTTTSFGGMQFPSFSPKAKVNLVVNFSFIGTCQNNNTTFFPAITPGADSVRWDFGDMTAASNDWSPVHKYATAQTFTATLTAFYQNQKQTSSQSISITPFPLQLKLVSDTTACSCELKFPKKPTPSCNRPFSVKVTATGGTPTSYTWSNGQTGPTMQPDSAGYYYVVVSDGSGCSAYAGVNIKEYGVNDQRANVWYFGKNAGINFNVQPPIPLSNSAMDAPEGCAIICDRNGKAIFYTDGDKVYNKNDVQIASGIGGDVLASQSSIIVPVPGDETLYYIFTNQANNSSGNTTTYSLFDLKQNSGLGAVVKQNVPLFSRSTERITASSKWLIIHEFGNNTFRVYPILQAGIGDPILTSIGSDHSFFNLLEAEGYMKLGPKNNLAVAYATGVANSVELFHLNDTTGKITNYRKIDLKEPTGQVYGIEFSPGGNKLFATVKGPPSELFEYSIDSIGHPHFKQRLQQPTELGAIQIAPDGQIYMAINGSNILGTIQPADDTTRLSVVNFSGFNLAAGTTSRLGLPNFIQQVGNAFGGPDFDFSGVCLGDSTKFVGTPTDAIDMFTWFFGDGGGKPISSDPTAAHLYAAAGTFNVSMNLTNRCGLDTTLVKPITIFAKPAKPTIPGATALCNGPVLLDANTGNIPSLMYLWSGGETTKTVTVTQQSIVSVVITDQNGCTSTGQSLVADNQPKVDLGPDQTLCQNSFTTALNANNPGATFLWTVNGASPTTAQSRALDTTTPGLFDYKVTITDPITTCTATDDAQFTIIASPSFSLSGTNPTSCNAANGVLTLTLSTTSPPTGPYSYFMSGPNSFAQQAVDQTAPKVVNFNGLKAGTYSGVVSDQVSGCSISQSFGLSDAPAGSASATPVTFCDPETVQLTTSMTFPLQYQVTNNGTGVVTGPTAATGPSPFNISTPLTAGTYTIQLTDNAGCIFNINNFAVTPNAPVAMTLTPTVCTTPPTITASGGATSFVWTGPNIVGPNNNSSIQVSGQGSFTYSVVGSAAGACPNTQTITVVLDNPNPDFTQSDPCQTSVVLSATPSGNYTYRWYKSSVFQPALLGQQISVGLTENGSSFQTELYNTLNGCAYRSAPKTIQVSGSVDAGLTATPACNDNNPFTLSAITTATGVTYAWFKDNVAIPSLTTPNINQTDAGTYKVEISKSAACKATAQISIVKAPLPVGQLPNRRIICNDPENKDPKTNQVDLDPGSFVKYDWFKNELTLSYTQRVLTATSQGKYKVDITNSFGCVASDETEILNECIPKIEVPNAFRPTSSISENKDFYAFTFFIEDTNFQVFIYNRWGELIYTSSDRYFKWNGGLNNNLSQPVPGGAYAYLIRYVSAFHPERGVQEQRGGVALLR